MLELTEPRPVDLREPVRGLLWITGMLRMPTPSGARRIAVGMAEARPHPRLLDLGHGATLVRLDPGSAVLSDAEGTAALAPVDLAAAAPDPFCRYETQLARPTWRARTPTSSTALHRHLPPALRDDRDARIRPLGLDRFGLRLRVETADRDHDVRLAFGRRGDDHRGPAEQMGRLVGCPFGGSDTCGR